MSSREWYAARLLKFIAYSYANLSYFLVLVDLHPCWAAYSSWPQAGEFTFGFGGHHQGGGLWFDRDPCWLQEFAEGRTEGGKRTLLKIHLSFSRSYLFYFLQDWKKRVAQVFVHIALLIMKLCIDSAVDGPWNAFRKAIWWKGGCVFVWHHSVAATDTRGKQPITQTINYTHNLISYS